MWNLNDYADESTIEECKKQFRRIYPEFKPHFLGVSQDKKSLIAECEFPDGIFYFRVTENSVSAAYKTLEEANRL